MTKFYNDIKFVPTAPKTETRIVLEQQDLYPDLGYEDVSEQRGYGPTDKKKSDEELAKELLKEEKKYLEHKRDGMLASLAGQALGPLAVPVGGGCLDGERIS